tara:strand:- start:661 stop:897 length:237 start_codon:yes stop_codon:yes gene_type:complete
VIEIMVKVAHYRKNCIGCNSCVELDPDHWEMNEEDGKSDLKESKVKKGVYVVEITEFERENSEKAAESCPVNVIKVEG